MMMMSGTYLALPVSRFGEKRGTVSALLVACRALKDLVHSKHSGRHKREGKTGAGDAPTPCQLSFLTAPRFLRCLERLMS
jgi:hypothetical protein